MNTKGIAIASVISLYIVFATIYLQHLSHALISGQAITQTVIVGAAALITSFLAMAKVFVMHHMDRKDMLCQQAKGFRLLWETFHITVLFPVIAVIFLIGTVSSIIYTTLAVVVMTLIYAQLPKKENNWEMIDK